MTDVQVTAPARRKELTALCKDMRQCAKELWRFGFNGDASRLEALSLKLEEDQEWPVVE